MKLNVYYTSYLIVLEELSLRIEDALEVFEQLQCHDVPFSKLFEKKYIDVVNKGRVGQLLEILLGLQNTNSLTDFVDGELKTNKAYPNGLPLETMFITQISSQVDELLNRKPFEESKLYQKIKSLLYVPVVKEGPSSEWYFKKPIYINFDNDEYIYQQLKKDYYSIIDQMHEHIMKDGNLHTSNGEMLQIRTKDSKPYFPIYSETYNKQISNKNFAFYFKKEFMKYHLMKSEHYPDITF